MSKLLDEIQGPNDIKTIKSEDYRKLAKEIRRFLVDKVSRTGGHLASNLGVVELTMALHIFLNFPEDKLVWDVGHQSYTHKILTGRKDGFDNLRNYNGLSGFPKTNESSCDAFDTGHSSTSISAALGMAKARDLEGKNNKVVAVIGDGALSGGMAYEALNNAARLKSNMMIVLNDNEMSISENVGGMSAYLGKIRSNSKYQDFKDDVQVAIRKIPKIGDSIVNKIRKSKDSIKRLIIPGMLFEDMGITYIGPIDGHNIEQLLSAFYSASKLKEAVIVHVNTKKGKGYIPAEKNPSIYHGIEAFSVKTGEPISTNSEKTYTGIFSDTMLKLAKEDKRVVAITAAMPAGTGLEAFGETYPKRFFDVGIAEEHAVTFAAGLASEGFKPVVAVYSTFLQRAYDQIIHDVCLDNKHVIFAIDRAGIVGRDGETHQGIFDISFLSHIPNLVVMAPKNGIELEAMLEYAINYDGPIAIRYPRGHASEELEEFKENIELGKSEIIHKEKGIAILAIGSMMDVADNVRNKLKEQGKEVSLINVRFISPMDIGLLTELFKDHNKIITMEENITYGGFGEKVSSYILTKNYKGIQHMNISVPNEFIEHGDCDTLKKKLKLDCDSILERIAGWDIE